MAIAAIIRRSISSVTPLARRLSQPQSRYHSAAFTSLFNTTVSPKPASVPFAQTHHCSFSSSAVATRFSSDESLLSVIETEIKCAEETDNRGVEEIPSSFPFKIEDIPGQQTISLSRDYQGETIDVVVHMTDLDGQDDPEDNDDDNVSGERFNQSSLPLVVRVSKKDGPCLEFGCTAFPDEIQIDSLAVKDPENSEEQIPYEGPDFSDLDENLQKAFHKYLEIRGIKPSTTNFLHDYMLNKDSREYLLWLNNLKKFMEA